MFPVCQLCHQGGHIATQCSKLEICQLCHKRGHIAKECSKMKICQLCHQRGHIAPQCPNNYEKKNHHSKRFYNDYDCVNNNSKSHKNKKIDQVKYQHSSLITKEYTDNKELNKSNANKFQEVLENDLLTKLNDSIQNIYQFPNEGIIQYANRLIIKTNEVVKQCDIETILSNNIKFGETAQSLLIKHFIQGLKSVSYCKPCKTLRETVQNAVSIEQIKSYNNSQSVSNEIKSTKIQLKAKKQFENLDTKSDVTSKFQTNKNIFPFSNLLNNVIHYSSQRNNDCCNITSSNESIKISNSNPCDIRKLDQVNTSSNSLTESDFSTLEYTKPLNNQDEIIEIPNSTDKLISLSDSHSSNTIYNFTSFILLPRLITSKDQANHLKAFSYSPVSNSNIISDEVSEFSKYQDTSSNFSIDKNIENNTSYPKYNLVLNTRDDKTKYQTNYILPNCNTIEMKDTKAYHISELDKNLQINCFMNEGKVSKYNFIIQALNYFNNLFKSTPAIQLMFKTLKLPRNIKLLLFKFNINSNKSKKNFINRNLLLNNLHKQRCCQFRYSIYNYFYIKNIIQNTLKHESMSEINFELKILPI